MYYNDDDYADDDYADDAAVVENDDDREDCTVIMNE